MRSKPLSQRKKLLFKIIKRAGGIEYVEHLTGHGPTIFEHACRLGYEGIVSKRSGSFYKSGPTKMWIKVKNPKAPAATRVLEGGF